MLKPRCSSGIVTPALVGLDFTMVAWTVHPHLILLQLTPLLLLILIMMKRAEKKMKMMSEAS
jgi:hypothetical protein